MNATEKEKSKAIDPFDRAAKSNGRKQNLWIFAVFLPFCVFVWVTSGCFYMPMTGGGIFLPALPTFFIAVAASGYSLSAMLSIMLYRKTMPDRKHQFLRIRRCSRKTAKYLMIAAIPVAVFQWLILLCGFDLFPLRGIAENFVLWRPEMVPLAGLFNNVGYGALGLLIAMSAAVFLAIVFYFSPLKRLYYFLFTLSIFLWGFGCFTMFAEGYFSGAMKYGDEIIYAVQDPARFNSMALTYFAVTVFFFSGGTAMLMAALSVGKELVKAGKAGASH